MNPLLLSSTTSTTGELALSVGLVVALIIVGVLISIASIVVFVARIIVMVKYHKYNHIDASSGHTAYSAARALLDANGMENVEVKQLGFFRALFYGNSYSARTKTIYLRKGIINKTSITAVGLAIQKVGHAVQDREGNKAFKFRSKVAPLALFAPMLVIPIFLVGIILDLLFSMGGVAAIISVVVGILIYALAFAFTLLTLPVESRANTLALEIMEQTNFLDEQERLAIKEVFSAYMIAYVMEFVVALLQIIKVILQILLQAVAKKSEK